MYCMVAHAAILRIRAKNPQIADQVAINYRKADITPRGAEESGLEPERGAGRISRVHLQPDVGRTDNSGRRRRPRPAQLWKGRARWCFLGRVDARNPPVETHGVGGTVRHSALTRVPTHACNVIGQPPGGGSAGRSDTTARLCATVDCQWASKAAAYRRPVLPPYNARR